MQTSREALVTSQSLQAFYIDNYNPYKLTYRYILKLVHCDKKPIKEKHKFFQLS